LLDERPQRAFQKQRVARDPTASAGSPHARALPHPWIASEFAQGPARRFAQLQQVSRRLFSNLEPTVAEQLNQRLNPVFERLDS
jgi:hypothetical protein